MPGLHRHEADLARMLGAAGVRDRREFSYCRRALVAEYGLPPLTSLVRMAMLRVATRWTSLVAAERVLAETRAARMEGRGKGKPSQREVDRLAKRAALEDASYQGALVSLKQLVGPRLAPASGAELAAVSVSGNGGADRRTRRAKGSGIGRGSSSGEGE